MMPVKTDSVVQLTKSMNQNLAGSIMNLYRFQDNSEEKKLNSAAQTQNSNHHQNVRFQSLEPEALLSPTSIKDYENGEIELRNSRNPDVNLYTDGQSEIVEEAPVPAINKIKVSEHTNTPNGTPIKPKNDQTPIRGVAKLYPLVLVKEESADYTSKHMQNNTTGRKRV